MEEKKKCVGCGTNESMSKVTMSSADWQRNEQRHERREKRLWIALIIAITIIFAQFAGFVWYESQFETISYDYAQDGNGTNIIGEGNEVNNGSTLESENQEETQE